VKNSYYIDTIDTSTATNDEDMVRIIE
jgi:hypothetical protein